MKRTVRSQKNIIRDHLEEKGSITFFECIIKFRVQRLSDIIFQLRNEGYNIVSERKPGINGTHYVKYVLIREKDKESVKISDLKKNSK